MTTKPRSKAGSSCLRRIEICFCCRVCSNDGGFQTMKMKLLIFFLLSAFAFAPSLVFGQAAEVNPYGGFYWPNHNNGVGEFQNNQLLGVRGGGYITKSFELGGNWAWSNHFQPNSENTTAALAGDVGFTQDKVRANIWEAEFSYNFGKRSLFGSSVRPYLTAGGGALRTSVKDSGEFVLNVKPVTLPCGCTKFTANDVLDDGDTFFTF